ncbi:MAG TPA: winged helix-turn-helix domain-containing protein [Dokdonella sp.]|nr:winged helix-turn-helix domain-containing protein [Dokdonella sp.]
MLQFRFDEFRLDPARRELWRGDALLSLPPKAFDCIAYLIEHRARAVGRDELMAAVWGRSEVSDNLLDQVMLRARRTLGDTDEARRMIRTVPRFGYAWVAPVEVMEGGRSPDSAPVSVADASASGDAIEAADRTGAVANEPFARPSRLLRLAIVGAFALCTVVVAGWWWRAPAPPSASHASLALLLPVVVEADAKYAWARLGVMDLIADRLRGAGQAMVPSDNVIPLARELGTAEPDAAQLQEIAQASTAALVLRARAALSGGYWRVSVQSLRGRTPALFVEGEARELLEAARIAADRAAVKLGLDPPRDDELLPPRERALNGVLQQVEAAMLADQLDTARALLDTLDGEQSARPDVRFRRADIDFRSGRLDAAQATFDALLGAGSADDDPLFRARVLNGLGNVALRRDDYAAVERRSDSVVALLGTAAPSPELGRALTGRAIARSAQFRFDDAVADFAQARVVLESVGDRLGLARIDANLGILEARRDRYADALPLLERGGTQLANFHDRTSELFARVAAAYAKLYLLDPAAALAGEARLRELVEREPNPQWRRYATLARVDVLGANGRTTEARALLSGVLEDATRAGDAPLLGSARIIAAREALADGDAARAANEAGEVLKTSWQAETPREQAGAWLTLVRARIARGDLAAAREDVAALARWAERDGAPVAALHAALARAEHAMASGLAAQADTDFLAALALAERERVPDDLLRVCGAYAQALLARGDLARAGPVAARAASWAAQDYEAALLQLRLYHALAQVEPWRNALDRARRLAGERIVPVEFTREPVRAPTR